MDNTELLYILPRMSRMNMEETESMNRTIISNETDKQKTPTTKSQPVSQVNYTKLFQKN